MKPGTTGVVPAASRGRNARRARRPDSGRLGRRRHAGCRSRRSGRRRHTGRARPFFVRTAASRAADMRSPRDDQDVAGARRCGRARPARRTARGIARRARRWSRAGRGGPVQPAAARGRSRDAGAGAPPRPGSRRRPCPPPRARALEQLVGDARQRRARPRRADPDASRSARRRAESRARRPARPRRISTLRDRDAVRRSRLPFRHTPLSGRGQFIDGATHRVVAVGQFDRGVGVARRHAVERARVIARP